MNYHFSKKKRLLKKSEFNHVFQKGKRLSSSGFVILYIPNSFGVSRLGFVISKKNVAKAHDRNKVKRQTRELFRKCLNLPSYDLVFLAKHNIHLVDRFLFKSKIEEIWCKLINLSEK